MDNQVLLFLRLEDPWPWVNLRTWWFSSPSLIWHQIRVRTQGLLWSGLHTTISVWDVPTHQMRIGFNNSHHENYSSYCCATSGFFNLYMVKLNHHEYTACFASTKLRQSRGFDSLLIPIYDYIFLSNTWKGIRPVRLRKHQYIIRKVILLLEHLLHCTGLFEIQFMDHHKL